MGNIDLTKYIRTEKPSLDELVGVVETYEDGSYALPGCDNHQFYELAPALPEDEECDGYEVVEVVDWSWEYTNGKPIVEINATKPDGKKLKIKVIKP